MQTSANPTPQNEETSQAAAIQHPATAAVQAKASKPQPKTRAAKAKAAKASSAAQPARFVKAPAAAPDATPETTLEAALEEFKNEPVRISPTYEEPTLGAQVWDMYKHNPSGTLAQRAAQNLALQELAAKVVPATQRVLQYDSPQDMAYLAQDLAKFIKDNKLVADVQGKQFVNVEGWAYAGSRLGFIPVVQECSDQSTQAEIKYQARVSIIHLATGNTVGAGWAVCSSKESGKKFYQEFAINSMSQTRATGKAYRNILGWVMKAAGYEACPLEELEYNTNSPAAAAPAAEAVLDATTETGQPAPVPNPAANLKNLPATGKEGQPLPGQEEVANPVTYATAAQKEEIIRLLNHPVILLSEKSKMLLNINRLDVERAGQALEKLANTIEDRLAQKNKKQAQGPAADNAAVTAA